MAYPITYMCSQAGDKKLKVKAQKPEENANLKYIYIKKKGK